MHSRLVSPSIEPPPDRSIWMTAILFYGVGDVVTTGIGVRMEGLTEMGPLLAFLIEQYDLDLVATFVAAVGVKAAFFGGCYAVWMRLPRPHCVSVPLGLALVGISVTAWNLYHVIYLAQPF
ncbi:hypothetical protein [Halapricum hydrolyticum]|uniref:DUF5658 domain-containing protein n=1 Tax=Halapricum hydrolyticum TaxID=2979991 RepID=A0AAE3ICH0_9EURY|nr:hypothetical protein [Halapricum hydrolyticum]MCU4719609.1 hypothetical protein [Halapricum hydrolyticum]MCU4728095.1 hypothetical protein [Halapricum hydrolyticum]